MEFSRYQEACQHFLEVLVQGLINDFDIPQENIRLFPLAGKPDPKIKSTVREAMLLEQDRFWHIGIEITLLCQSCTTDPVQPIQINLGVKKEDQFFLLKTSLDKEPLKIPEANTQQLKIFYDDVFNRIKAYLGKSVNVLLEKEHTICKIGFKRDCE